MKHSKQGFLAGLVLAVFAVLAAPNPGIAQDFAGDFGLGIQGSVLNLGAGPTAKFFVSDHIAVQGTLVALGDYTTYAARGLWQFDEVGRAGKSRIYPYAGFGYAKIQGPEQSGNIYGVSWSAKTGGSGAEIFAGAMFDLHRQTKRKIQAAVEVVYSPIELKGTYSIGGFTYETKADYSTVFPTASIIYYF